MLKTIKKIRNETPLTGRVVDGLVDDQPNSNAPSISAVINGMTPPMNLLINGDFQINQRGQENYSSNSSVRSYGLDMWCSQISNGQTLIVYPAGDDGVRITGTSVSGQYFQEIEHIENGKNHILSTVIKINAGSGTIKLIYFDGTSFFTKDLVDGYNEFDLSTSNIYRAGLIVSGSVDFFCNYIRLDEGKIAYQNIKEDKGIALMRCQRFLQIGRTPYCAPKDGGITTATIELRGNFIRPMDSTPTLTVTDGSGNENTIERVNPGSGTSSTTPTTVRAEDNLSYFISSDLGMPANSIYCFYTASCEPL